MDMVMALNGLDDTLRAMARLPTSMRNKAIRVALRQGAALIRASAVDKLVGQQSKRATGKLSKSIIVKNLRMKNKELRVAVVLNRAKSRKGVRVGLYGSVFEFGKADQKPRPYLRPAIKENAARAINLIVNEARNNIRVAVEDAKK